MTPRFASMTLLLLLALAVPAASADGEAIVGLWATAPDDHGYAHVEIRPAGNELSGTIVWLSEPVYPPDDEGGMGGRLKVDRENPDPSLRARPIEGLEILNGFEYDGGGQWKRGTIYDPASGKTYKCTIKLQDDGSLKVRGFVGISLLGRTTVWTRADSSSR